MDSQVRDYFAAVPVHRKDKLNKLRSIIVSRFPAAIVDMRYKMPTYFVGEGWVAIANQKNYVSLYTCSAEHLADFKAQHPDIKTGKGCINFRDRDSIPEAAVKQVIERAISSPKWS